MPQSLSTARVFGGSPNHGRGAHFMGRLTPHEITRMHPKPGAENGGIAQKMGGVGPPFFDILTNGCKKWPQSGMGVPTSPENHSS